MTRTGRLTRREVLRLVALGGGGVVFATTLSDEASGMPNTRSDVGVVGHVEAVSGPEVMLRTDDDAQVRLMIQSSVRMYAGSYGVVSSAEDLIVGDRVFAMGAWLDESTLTTTDVGSIFDVATIEIVDVQPSRGRNARGAMETLEAGLLPDDQVLRVDVSRLMPGQVIEATTWTHPATGVRYLMLVRE